MKKEKLKNIKMKHDNSMMELDVSGIMTDVEKDRTARKDKIAKNYENRNLSIDKIRKANDVSIDRTTQNLKDKIKKNLEAMRVSNPKTGKTKNNDLNKSVQKRNITPIKSRNKASLDKSKRELKTSLKIKRGTFNDEDEDTEPKPERSTSHKNILDEEEKEPKPMKKPRTSLENYEEKKI